jgi:hypothetical protein
VVIDRLIIRYDGPPAVQRTAPQDQVITILVRALTPYVGAMMASASVRGQCERFFRDAILVDRAQIEQVIGELEPGLHVFVGKGKAESIVREIWSALGAFGREP